MKNFVKGETTEEKFDSIECSLKHFSRRLHRTIMVFTPPVPILGFVKRPEEDGSVMRCILPASGKISKGCFLIEKASENVKEVTVKASIISKLGGETSMSMSTRVGRPILLQPSLVVEGGDRLIISVPNPSEVSCIWVGFLYEVARSEMRSEKLLIEELEKAMENEREEHNEGV